MDGPAALHEGRTVTTGTGCECPGPPNITRGALQCKKTLVIGGIGLAASLLGSPDPLQGNHANMKHPIAISPGTREMTVLSCIQWQPAMTLQPLRTLFRRQKRKVKYSCQSSLYISLSSTVHVLLVHTINSTYENMSFRKNWGVELQVGFRNIYGFNLKYYLNTAV